MILRGVFTCGWKDQDYFYSESGAARFSPEAWDAFISSLPPGDGRIQERLHRLLEESDEEGKKKWCQIQAAYEYSFFNLPVEDLEKGIHNFEENFPEMRINSHYQANRFFLEDEQILKNTHIIKDIPVTIVHGKRDVICPPIMAWRLHKRLPQSKLIWVDDAGHLSSEPGIRQVLLKVMKS